MVIESYKNLSELIEEGDDYFLINSFLLFYSHSLPDTNLFGHKEGNNRVLVSRQDGTGWALTSGSVHSITASSIFLRLTKCVCTSVIECMVHMHTLGLY